MHIRMPRPSDAHGIGRAAEDVHNGDRVEEGVAREDVPTVHMCLDCGRRIGGVWEETHFGFKSSSRRRFMYLAAL